MSLIVGQRRVSKSVFLLLAAFSIISSLYYMRQHLPPLGTVDRHNTKAGLQRVNRGIVTYSDEFFQRMTVLTSRNADALDTELVELVSEVIDPPATGDLLKMSRHLVETPQSKEVETLLKSKRGGFFLECGGLDGERSSNTIWLEKVRGWTGLLVEMDPFFYTQLLGKNRKSWSLNACLSPTKHPVLVPFRPSGTGSGKLVHSKRNSTAVREAKLEIAPCFPLETVLAALNRTHVDYFSLDVEGLELEILKTIPFERISFDVLTVEFIHIPEGKQAAIDFMAQQGYRLNKTLIVFKYELFLSVEDLIFVKA